MQKTTYKENTESWEYKNKGIPCRFSRNKTVVLGQSVVSPNSEKKPNDFTCSASSSPTKRPTNANNWGNQRFNLDKHQLQFRHSAYNFRRGDRLYSKTEDITEGYRPLHLHRKTTINQRPIKIRRQEQNAFQSTTQQQNINWIDNKLGWIKRHKREWLFKPNKQNIQKISKNVLKEGLSFGVKKQTDNIFKWEEKPFKKIDKSSKVYEVTKLNKQKQNYTSYIQFTKNDRKQRVNEGLNQNQFRFDFTQPCFQIGQYSGRKNERLMQKVQTVQSINFEQESDCQDKESQVEYVI